MFVMFFFFDNCVINFNIFSLYIQTTIAEGPKLSLSYLYTIIYIWK